MLSQVRIATEMNTSAVVCTNVLAGCRGLFCPPGAGRPGPIRFRTFFFMCAWFRIEVLVTLLHPHSFSFARAHGCALISRGSVYVVFLLRTTV
jgi:hypothetical protein